MQINRQSVAGFFVGSLLSLLATGCGSGYSLGTVTGTVTLDGKPLPQATVTFSRGKGRTSVGTTDEQGRYKLLYTVNQQGAEPGLTRFLLPRRSTPSVARGTWLPLKAAKSYCLHATTKRPNSPLR